MLQRGNILFLILLAIVLFAALAYAVTSSLRGGGKDASAENADAAAADILNFLDQVSTATQRMNLTGNIPYTKISYTHTSRYFDNSVVTNAYDNPNCTSDICRIFRPDGGNIALRTFEKYGNMNSFNISSSSRMPGYPRIFGVRWPYAGTDSNDVAIQVVYINGSVCDQIANRLSLPTDVTMSGSITNAGDPADWDSISYSVSSSLTLFVDKNTMLNYAGTGSQRYCHVSRLLITR